MAQSSIFVAFCIRLFIAINHSTFINKINDFVSWFINVFRYSFLNSILGRKKSIEDYSDSSVFYKVLKYITDNLIKVLTEIYDAFRDFNAGSLNFGFYNRFIKSSYIFKTENLLSIFVVLMYIIPHKLWNNSYALGSALLLGVVYVLALFSGRKLGKNPKKVWLSLLLFVFATALGVFVSSVKHDSLRVFVFFATSFIFCMLVYGTLTDYKRIQNFLGFIFIAVVITSIMAIIQRMMGIKVDPSLTDVNLNKGMPGRAYASLGNPNNYAEFLVLFTPFCFAFALNLKDFRQKIFSLMLILLPLSALALTYSRSGFIALGIVVILYTALYNRKYLPVIIVGIICVIPLLPSSVYQRILTIGNMKDSSSSYRLYIWEGSLALLKKYWVTGIGLGPSAFSSVYRSFANTRAILAPHSHMLYMEVLIEMGIMGFLSFLWYSISLIRRSIIATFNEKSKELKNILIACASSVAAIIFIGLAEYIWFYPRVMFAFFIMAGISMAAIRVSNSRDTD